MTSSAAPDDRDLDAGAFGSWLGAIRGAIAGERASVVPCDGCTACCTSSQFVEIEPDETAARARIDPGLLFPAPGRPGHDVLGYDERGHCPMLVNGRCSIYEDRPRACRTYDCRVFAATGIEPGAGKDAIADRVARWRFSFAADSERVQHEASHAAARFLDEHARELGDVPADPTQLAVLAVAVHDQFVAPDGRALASPGAAAVRVAITRRRRGP